MLKKIRSYQVISIEKFKNILKKLNRQEIEDVRSCMRDVDTTTILKTIDDQLEKSIKDKRKELLNEIYQKSNISIPDHLLNTLHFRNVLSELLKKIDFVKNSFASGSHYDLDSEINFKTNNLCESFDKMRKLLETYSL